jgi:hypothetical protein
MWDYNLDVDCYCCGIAVAPTKVEWTEEGEPYPVDYPAACPECDEPLSLDGPAPYTGQDERRQLGMSWF